MSAHIDALDALRGLIDGECDEFALTLQPVVDVLQAVEKLSTSEMASRIVAKLENEKMIEFTMAWQRREVTKVVRQVLDAELKGVFGADHDSGPSEG